MYIQIYHTFNKILNMSLTMFTYKCKSINIVLLILLIYNREAIIMIVRYSSEFNDIYIYIQYFFKYE